MLQMATPKCLPIFSFSVLFSSLKGIGRGTLDPGKLPQPSDKSLFIPY